MKKSCVLRCKYARGGWGFLIHWKERTDGLDMK